MKTRRFWEKTRETPDQSLGLSAKCSSPISVNEGPGQLFFHSSPSRRCTIEKPISPQSLHERSYHAVR